MPACRLQRAGAGSVGLPAPKDIIILRQAALIGIVTLHLAMPQVIDNYPDRADPTVDGYIAVVDCGEIGRRYVLQLDGQTYLVAVADCAQVRDVAHIEYAFGGRWIADVDATIWDDLPRYPQEATLWPENVYKAWQRQMDRVQ